MIVFLDTNILFSAILFPKSTPDIALQKALNFPNIAVTSDYCLMELHRKFSEKYPSKINSLNSFLKIFMFYVRIAKTTNNFVKLEEKVRDINDRPILRSAIEINADVIITGDKDLLELNLDHPKPISPAQFLNNYWNYLLFNHFS